MKLLIVDDEELTRTGVISSIDWKMLGIDEVLQADDGIHGLEIARDCRPEIILCDVRMPRMDGITMLEKLESFLPDAAVIFMSGYSDKEYLKAAIKLKAVSYIEKPLNPAEIQSAVREAAELYIRRLRSHHGETLHSLETASRLALMLTVPYHKNSEAIQQLSEELSLRLTPGTFFTAFIVKRNTVTESLESSMGSISSDLAEFLKYYHLYCIQVEKRLQYMVYFVFGSSKPSKAVLHSIGQFLAEQSALSESFFIAAGESTAGISKAYQSYTSAVVLLQSSFFFPENTFLTQDLLSCPTYTDKAFLANSPETAFEKLLIANDANTCEEFMKKLILQFDRNTSLLVNQVKDFYYRLLLTLDNVRRQKKIPGHSAPDDSGIAAEMEHCFTFHDLHQVLTDRTDQFFRDLRTSTEENPTIYLIKDYISQNYMRETLSVKDISSHVFLSTSYVCTFFKNETGQTLNQYLTEYRMEQAKQLLSDSRYRISDISSRVGYSDGNYFGKSFKKYSGLSPSEYREKILK